MTQPDWPGFLAAMTLAMVRVSGLLVFAPFFSSAALPARAKIVFTILVAYLLAPLVATLPHAKTEIGFESVISELAVGMVYGLSLALLNEMMLFAGQVAGMQLSLSLVNLMDPTSTIQTPLLGELFESMGLLVMIAAGLDRILLHSMVRSFQAVPLGGFVFTQASALVIVRAASGIFLAAVELAAPILAATMLVEVSISLLGKLSPQLPVMQLSVPIKTLTGMGLLSGALALWPRFIEARFSGLLDMAERLLGAPGLRG